MTLPQYQVAASTLFAGDASSYVFDISISPNGSSFAVSGRTAVDAKVSSTRAKRPYSRGKKDVANVVFHNPDILDPSMPRTDFIALYDSTTMTEIGRCAGHVDTITDLTFTSIQSSGSNSLLASSSRDGTVRVWDTRTGTATGAQVSLIPCPEPLLSLSLNCDGELLAAGTEKVGDDARIRLWDVRAAGVAEYKGEEQTGTQRVFERGLVGDFMEAHSDDVTQVRFHPAHPKKLLSGGTDGIFNVFHISPSANQDEDHGGMDTSSQTSEEPAASPYLYDEDESLAFTASADSVHRLAWFGSDHSGWYTACLTHVETVGVWSEDVDPLASFGDVRRAADRKLGAPPVDYLMGTDFDGQEGRLRVVAGSNEGDVTIFNVNLNSLDPLCTLSGGHKELVRGFGRWAQVR
ncbi:WD40 repeat-like protein [Gonapodya prolifera JEL478]|uniref:WD40 repeat-like protein n=1 Tax=Gonapodya prolifera (strain JEL478) TaxID=1344416 RepID=A0A139A9F0_GONPJ|nr:WD40 repeat-like protein [Gonapodya prolifera JEL478]|eukprot:KXS13289.1 WD40 repeat-like protein [Gonapodya prolifera JEL478]